MRKRIVAGNWKMNKTLSEGIKLAEELVDGLKKTDLKGVEVVVCPPFIHLHAVSELATESSLNVGAQNCSGESAGAFTGEVSASMIKSTGARYVIVGHSERRSLFGEDDNLLLSKTVAAQKEGLEVIFCCGELLPEREAGVHCDIINSQLSNTVFKLSENEFKKIVLAYEPVWAIGTGVTASPAQAQEMHQFIRSLIDAKFGRAVAQSTTILYGGSCKASNAREIFSGADVDGGLIGGASLEAEEFLKIAGSF